MDVKKTPTYSPDFSRAPGLTSPIFWHFARKLVPWLVTLAIYLGAATSLVRWDMARHGEEQEDPGAALYGMYMQLFFEPTLALPRAPIARVVFWVTPLLGAGWSASGRPCSTSRSGGGSGFTSCVGE